MFQTTFTTVLLKIQLKLPNHALIHVIKRNFGEEKCGQPHFESVTQESGGAIFVHESNQYCWHYINMFQIGTTFHIICKPFRPYWSHSFITDMVLFWPAGVSCVGKWIFTVSKTWLCKEVDLNTVDTTNSLIPSDSMWLHKTQSALV